MARVINTIEFQNEVLNSPGVVLVDFFAVWCGPCKMLTPVLDELSVHMEGSAKILKVDVDRSPEIAQRYGISTVPTMILFKDGKAVEKIVGFQPKSVLRSRLQYLLN